MTIEIFTEEDIREAAFLAYPVWGEGHAANGQGEEFGLLMCEYIIRYGWYGAPFAFKITDEGKMMGCILAGNIEQDNGYNEWLDSVIPSFNEQQREEALAKSEGYENLYLWTDSSCNHGYYAHHGFEKVAEFKSDEWKTDSNNYITYIYKKSI